MKRIRIYLKILFISTIVFYLLSYLSYKNDLYLDGCESYGFPFNFYEVCADPSPEFVEGFKIKYLFLDISIIVISVFLITFFLSKRRELFNKN